MAERPVIQILSSDPLLGDLLAERLRQDHLEVGFAVSLEELSVACATRCPNVLVIDAIADLRLASGLLDDPWTPLGDAKPPLLLLAGSATPSAIRDHGYIDRVVAVPIGSDDLVGAILYAASGRARREMRSGIQLRAVVSETFKTKKTRLTEAG